MPFAGALDDILCVHAERVVGNDNTVRYRALKSVGERVLIVDGDNHFTGAAMAEFLADQGKRVTIANDAANVAEYTYFTMEMGNLKRMMHEKKIGHLAYHWPERIEPGAAVLYYMYRDSPDLTESGKWTVRTPGGHRDRPGGVRLCCVGDRACP